MDVIAYLRISSDRSGEQAGVSRQLADIRELAARNGDRIVEPIENDNDESAYLRRKPRPGFARLVSRVKAGEAHGIYAWHPDRLYRSLRDLEDLVDLVDAHSLMVRTAKAGDIDLATPTGRMTARIIGSMARYESEHGAERKARKHRELAESGKPGGGRRPFGYERDQITINPMEAAALRQAAESILAGESLAETSRAFSTAIGRPVRPNILRNTLTSPRIAGLRQHIPVADRRRGIETGITVNAVWEPIISLEDWQRLRAILLDPARHNTRPPRTYLLSGILKCGHCTTPMAGGNGSYRCSVSSGGCNRMSVSMMSADAHLTAWAKAQADQEVVRQRLAALAEQTEKPANQIDSLNAIQDRRATLAAMWAVGGPGGITDAEWQAARAGLDAREAELTLTDAVQARTAENARRAVSVLSNWDKSSVAERRTAISSVLGESVAVVLPRGKKNGSKFDPDRITIQRRA